MRIDHKREILQVNNDELTSLFNGIEKVINVDKHMGFIKRLDLTNDEKDAFNDIYVKLCPLFGVDPHELRKEVNIQSGVIQTQGHSEWR